MKKAMYTNNNGELILFTPSLELLTEEGFIDKRIPDGIIPVIIDGADMPINDNFIDAWEQDGDKLIVNMEKARNIRMDEIRELRKAKFSEIDIEINKAFDIDDLDELAILKTRRQALRDIPESFDLMTATTPEELKAIMPEELLEE